MNKTHTKHLKKYNTGSGGAGGVPTMSLDVSEFLLFDRAKEAGNDVNVEVYQETEISCFL